MKSFPRVVILIFKEYVIKKDLPLIMENAMSLIMTTMTTSTPTVHILFTKLSIFRSQSQKPYEFHM